MNRFKNISIVITLFAALTVPVDAQKIDSLLTQYKVKRANKAYENLSYKKAVKLYEKASATPFMPDSVKAQWASAYLRLAEPNQAERVLSSLPEEKMKPSDKYLYAQVLKENEKYTESDEWMEKYLQSNSNDSRIEKQKKSASTIEKLMKEERYDVSPVEFNTELSDFGAYPIGNQIVFASERKVDEVIGRQYSWKEKPYLNIFSISDSALLSSAHLLSPTLKSIYHDGPACFNADGSEIFFTRNVYVNALNMKGMRGFNHLKILTSTKGADGKWSTPKDLPFNNPNYSCGHPFLTADGNTLYFVSDMPGGVGGTDIYLSTRTNDIWSEPKNLGKQINTEGEEMFPFVDAKGNIYFSSNGQLTMGGLDIMVALKNASGYKIVNMGCPLNSSFDDFSFYLMPDDVNGYFSSNRIGGKGDDDIYKFSITKALQTVSKTVFILKDRKTKKIVSAQKIALSTIDGKPIVENETNVDGKFNFETEEHKQVVATAQLDGYFPLKQNVEISEENKLVELWVDPIPEYGVFGMVLDKSTNQGVDGIKVIIWSAKDGSVITNLTANSGTFRNKLAAETDYQITLSNDSYFAKKASFTTKGREPGWININEFMEPTIEKIEMNKVIEIPNIYYDLGKWNIRKDAAVELDKVVLFLTENPSISIELGSHTDSRGSALSNETLSQKRAQSAVDYIVKKGISKDRITAKGYGESKIKNQCAEGVKCTEEEHQQNRRTEIRIVGIK